MTQDEFQEYLEYWKIPLLESYIEILEDVFGNALSKICIERNFLNVLIRSYAHCILVLREVLCLIKNGYPDGALARSRRIYENMIIAKYLNTHKSDDDFNKVIERYFDDQDIRAYYGRMKLFRSTNHSDDAKACNTAMNKIIKKYKGSKDFDTKKKEILSNNYWWVKNSKTSFSKLSECLDDDYAKILYLRACYSTHAGALGDVALLGRPLADGLHLYTGKTYNGAAMSMQLAVSSFYNISDVMFENLEIVNPVSSEEFFALLHTYFKNSDDEVNEQKLYLNTPTQ